MISKSLARNTSFVLVARIINAVFSFIVFLLIARSLTDAELGLYTFSLSVAATVAVFSDWGGTQHLFRRGSASPHKIPRMLAASSASRAVLGFVISLFVTLLLALLRDDSAIAVALPLAMLVTLLASQTVAYISSFRARGNMSFEPWLFSGRGALKLACVAAVCHFHATLPAILLALIFVNSMGNVFAFRLDRKRYSQATPRITVPYARALMQRSTPYFVAGIYSMLLGQVAVLLLGILSDFQQVAIFGVAFQILQALLLLPMAFTIALQPVLVRTFERNKSDWSRQVRKLVGLSVIPALALAALLAFVLPLTLPILFDNRYDEAGPTLAILMFAFGFRVLWMAALYPAFVSGDQVKQWGQVLLVALLVQVTFTMLAAIPWGANGAAYGVLISDALVFLFGALRLHRLTRQAQL